MRSMDEPSRNACYDQAMGQHCGSCHFDRREKSFSHLSQSFGMTDPGQNVRT
jgi:mono/diheme cytochrome c family protein